MAKRSDKNNVSVRFRMFALLVTALPCIGFIRVIVRAFVGDNETRKNYFRAIIAWGPIFNSTWAGITGICQARGPQPQGRDLGLRPELLSAFPKWRGLLACAP